MVNPDQDNKEQRQRDSLGDDCYPSGDSDDTDSDESDKSGEFNIDSLKTASLKTSEHNSSDSSPSLSESETDEHDFHPELFGLLENPGVVRFGCLDYPLAVTEDGDEEYETEKEHDNVPDWIRVSCDDLTQNIDASWECLDDIHSMFSALHKKHTKLLLQFLSSN